MGSFSGLSIAKSGIFAFKKAMEATGHNIANVSTKGYTRQRVVLESKDPYLLSHAGKGTASVRVGTGVNVDNLEAVRDEFTNAKIVNQTSDHSYKEKSGELLSEIEHILNQGGDVKLNNQMDAYWKAWEDLSNDPSNSALRKNLTAETDKLISLFQDVDRELRELQGTSDRNCNGSIDSQMNKAVEKVNSIADQISEINLKIAKSEVSGANANELRDRRQVLLEELGDIINVDAFYSPIDGSLTVNCGNVRLIQHTAVNHLYVTEGQDDKLPVISTSPEFPTCSNNIEVADAILTTSGAPHNGTITVSQLAQAHEQYSFVTYKPADAPLSNFGITSGTFTMNGRSFELDAEKTSITGLVKMINDANIEVNASINESGQMVWKAAHTGEDYSICSGNGTSNIFTVIKMETAQEAKNAVFNFNDIEYVSQSNKVTDAVEGVVINLHGTGVADLDMRPILKDGTLKALTEVRDGSLQNTLDELNQLAYKIMTETNNVHRKGFTTSGKTGVNFFEPVLYDQVSYPYKDVIQQMSLSKEVKADLGNIAAAGGRYEKEGDRLKTSLGLGDGSNAISIAQLKQGKFFHNGKTTFDGFYNKTVTNVAVSVKTYTDKAEYSGQLLTQLETVRSQTAGVSLDEELANLIQYQHAYNACARVMTTIDEMIDKVVNGMI